LVFSNCGKFINFPFDISLLYFPRWHDWTSSMRFYEIQKAMRSNFYFYYIAINVYVFLSTNIYSFILYNYYATTILLIWILHTYKLCQSFWRLIFQFFSQVYSIKLFTFTCYFYQMKMFSKASNNHLYTKQKETKFKKFSKFYTSH
jgi:hypothetical protein